MKKTLTYRLTVTVAVEVELPDDQDEAEATEEAVDAELQLALYKKPDLAGGVSTVTGVERIS